MESIEDGIKVKWKKEGKYNRKLYQCLCKCCSKERYLRKSKMRDLCRSCAYIYNSHHINDYIKRPERGPDGRYKKGD